MKQKTVKTKLKKKKKVNKCLSDVLNDRTKIKNVVHWLQTSKLKHFRWQRMPWTMIKSGNNTESTKQLCSHNSNNKQGDIGDDDEYEKNGSKTSSRNSKENQAF